MLGGGAKLVRSGELLLCGSKGLGWWQRLLGGGAILLLWESSLWWPRAIVATLLLVVEGRRGWLLLPLAWPPCTLGIIKRLDKTLVLQATPFTERKGVVMLQLTSCHTNQRDNKMLTSAKHVVVTP